MNINPVQINIYCSDWSLKIIHWLNTHHKGVIHNTSLFLRYWKGLKEQVVHLQLRSFVVCSGNINRRLIQSDNPGLGASPNFLISIHFLSFSTNHSFIHDLSFLQICTVHEIMLILRKIATFAAVHVVFTFVKLLGFKQGGFNSSLPEWSQPGR